MSLTKEALELLQQSLMLQTKPWNIDGVPIVARPNNCTFESLEKLLPPTYIDAAPEFCDAVSFASYVNRFKTPDTLLFGDYNGTSVKVAAVIDYHAPPHPDLISANRCKHVARFLAQMTPEYKRLLKQDRQRLGQMEFALWLEDNLDLFTEPSGADLLELIQSLTGSNEVAFESSARLQNGASRLNFSEEVNLRGTTTSKPGSLELPAKLTAVCAIFEGQVPWQFQARFKYRIESRKLSLWYELINLERVAIDNTKLLLQQIQEATEIEVLRSSYKQT